MLHVWRRFIPKRRTFEHYTSELHIFTRAHSIVDERLINIDRRNHRVQQLDVIIERMRAAASTGTPAELLALLVLQVPRAVVAQRQMDRHPHGYQNREARLFELIDFNDTYVQLVLNLPEPELTDFDDRTKRLLDRFCKYMQSPCFSNEQWQAITHGLSREIAVYRGALKEGLEAEMTSRSDDAKGVDMVIRDPASGRSINIDVKTRSAYHFRLKDLQREGRISTDQQAHAEAVGYCLSLNGIKGEQIETILFRAEREELGAVINFRFENAHLLGLKLREMIAQYGNKNER